MCVIRILEGEKVWRRKKKFKEIIAQMFPDLANDIYNYKHKNPSKLQTGHTQRNTLSDISWSC